MSDIKINRFLFIILGIVCGFLGISIIINPKFYSAKYSYYFDFTEIKWIVGGLCLLFAVLALWISFKRDSKFTDIQLICPKCEDVFKWNETQTQTCPKCQTKLENLKGFYERHPELKN